MLPDKSKLVIALSLFLIGFFHFSMNDSSALQQKISIYLNGEEETDWEPQFLNGRVYIPVRLMESLGSKVSWDATKQTVTINADIKMIASIPEEDVYLYALNKENNFYKDLVVSSKGVKKVYEWKTIEKITDLPQLYYVDLNNDQKKELVIVLSEGHGTGFSVQNIHIVNPENFTEYSIENPLDIVKKHVATKIISDSEVEIKIDGKVSSLNLKNSSFPERISEISFENIINYQIFENKIMAIVGVEGAYLQHIGYLKIEYHFKDGTYKMKNISFSQD
ncbi:stalk domain-containing protein [Brevibacillus gelatini]|uniref:stalk domain-containing protein n=1 Tax=Brevibacillus gelatini TaxID=1655277 RepID=UPI003D819FFF